MAAMWINGFRSTPFFVPLSPSCLPASCVICGWMLPRNGTDTSPFMNIASRCKSRKKGRNRNVRVKWVENQIFAKIVILCKLLNGTDAIPIYKSRRESMEFRRLALYSKNISSDFSKIKLGESITLFLKEAILLVDVSPNIMTTLFLLSSK